MQAAIEEGVVVGGGCSLLRLSKKVDGIKELLDNEEQKVIFLFWFSCYLDNPYFYLKNIYVTFPSHIKTITKFLSNNFLSCALL